MGRVDLTIQQLRMLREVSELGTIAAAADALGYTPSAVSQQLASIGKSTGVGVLERVGRNVQLTDAGRELVVHADIVLAELERAQASLERVTGSCCRNHSGGAQRIDGIDVPSTATPESGDRPSRVGDPNRRVPLRGFRCRSGSIRPAGRLFRDGQQSRTGAGRHHIRAAVSRLVSDRRAGRVTWGRGRNEDGTRTNSPTHHSFSPRIGCGVAG